VRTGRAAIGAVPDRTAGAVLAILVALVVLLGIWFVALDRGTGRSIDVNDHTDNSVPLVDRQAPRLSIGA
jgi:hypothetical protein